MSYYREGEKACGATSKESFDTRLRLSKKKKKFIYACGNNYRNRPQNRSRL